ncbi:STAS domain-containing protein [Streptomonospora wellingtoniae]|uniref:Anti-sigma factor antagonist n=1 Tax=Streptomonospora wellingtoniae TaxID=3075544 RepID=A0ABU2KS33_9ACTN|nr:hypothetical protein [Streptomonospora sp. DSM 45055]MDT0301948.1 hypothetical protein [Streptomonospora sp. DSM 45055]
MKQPTQIVAKTDYIGRGAVVTVPQSIEPWHTRCLREQLLWLLNERLDEVVIDFTPTIACTSAMSEALERVYTRTRARGMGLSLVLDQDSPPAKALEASGLTRLLHVHADRGEAERGLRERAASRTRRGTGQDPNPVPPPRGGPVAKAS